MSANVATTVSAPEAKAAPAGGMAGAANGSPDAALFAMMVRDEAEPAPAAEKPAAKPQAGASKAKPSAPQTEAKTKKPDEAAPTDKAATETTAASEPAIVNDVLAAAAQLVPPLVPASETPATAVAAPSEAALDKAATPAPVDPSLAFAVAMAVPAPASASIVAQPVLPPTPALAPVAVKPEAALVPAPLAVETAVAVALPTPQPAATGPAALAATATPAPVAPAAAEPAVAPVAEIVAPAPQSQPKVPSASRAASAAGQNAADAAVQRAATTSVPAQSVSGAAPPVQSVAPAPAAQAEAVTAAPAAPLLDAQAAITVATAAPVPGVKPAPPAKPSAQPTPRSGLANAAAVVAEVTPANANAVKALAHAADQGPAAGVELTAAPETDLAATDGAGAEVKTEAASQTTASSSAPTNSPTASSLAAPQAGGGTVAALAAQIIRKSEGKASRFEVQLDPHGLGQVTVSVRIDAQGRLSAALGFDNPAAQAQLHARSGELRASLEQAGFDLSKGGLSFDSADAQTGGQTPGEGFGRSQQEGAAFRGRAFGAASQALDLADLASVAPQRQGAASGLDLRI